MISTPTVPVRRAMTMTADHVGVLVILRLRGHDVPTNPGIVVRPVIPIGTMTALAGRLPMATAVPPAMTIAAHHVPTAEMTVVRRAMTIAAHHVPSPVVTAVDHEMVALVHLDGSLMIAAELLVAMMIAVHLVPTAVMTAVHLEMVAPVHLAGNSMTAVVGHDAPAHRERVRPVVTMTALHVIAGVKIAPRSHVHRATSRVRGFSEKTRVLVLIAKTRVPGLIVTTVRAVVAPRTVIAVSVRSHQKSKSGLMPSESRSLAAGVA